MVVLWILVTMFHFRWGRNILKRCPIFYWPQFCCWSPGQITNSLEDTDDICRRKPVQNGQFCDILESSAILNKERMRLLLTVKACCCIEGKTGTKTETEFITNIFAGLCLGVKWTRCCFVFVYWLYSCSSTVLCDSAV